MREKVKGFAVGCAVTLVLTGAVSVFSSPIEKMISAVYSNIKIVVDGKEVIPKDANGDAVEPFIYNGTTYLPVRAIGEALGKEINWDGKTSTVYLGAVPELLTTINDEEIMLSDFMVYLNNSKDSIDRSLQQTGATLENGTFNGKPAMQAVKEMALEQLYKDVVVAQNAKSLGIKIDDNGSKMITEKVSSYIDMLGGKEQIKKMGISEADVTKSIERSYYYFMLYNKLSTDPQFQPSADVIKDYATKNLIRARHILLKTTDAQGQPMSDDDKKKIKEKMETMLKDIKGGADFAKLMETNSEDPGSKAQPDGYYFGKGMMVKEFEDASFALKEGELSGIIETRFGYHIIKRESLVEKFDSYIAEPKNKQSIVDGMTNDELTKKITAWISNAKISIVQDVLDKVK